MVLKKRFPLVLLSFLSIFFIVAGFALAQEQAKSDKEADEQKAVEKKALGLLDEIIADAQTLKLPGNRIYVQVTAADLLWPRDEKRARKLVKDAMSGWIEISGNVDPNDPHSETIEALSNLRGMILQVLSRRDPEMALEFLRSTRQFVVKTNSKGDQPDEELNLQMQIAMGVAANDPAEAVRIAEESLQRGYSSYIFSLFTHLRRKDHDSAARLVKALITKLQGENFTKNEQAAGMALTLMRFEARLVRQQGGQESSSNKKHLLDERMLRDLVNIVVTAALSTSTTSPNWREQQSSRSLLSELQPFMPEIEKYAPLRAEALREKMMEYNRGLDPYARLEREFNNLSANGTIDDMLKYADKTPPHMHSNIYWRAIHKTVSEGDIERARQIANDGISNPVDRNSALEYIDINIIHQAGERGKLEEAQHAISRLRSDEERAKMLARMSETMSKKGDKKAALKLLDEARSFLKYPMEKPAQLEAANVVARAYASLKPTAGFEIIESLIDRVNQLIEATAMLQGFPGGGPHGVFKDGEMIMERRWAFINAVYTQHAMLLEPLARADFDRAKSVADRFSRLDARIQARLYVAQGALSESK